MQKLRWNWLKKWRKYFEKAQDPNVSSKVVSPCYERNVALKYSAQNIL